MAEMDIAEEIVARGKRKLDPQERRALSYEGRRAAVLRIINTPADPETKKKPDTQDIVYTLLHQLGVTANGAALSQFLEGLEPKYTALSSKLRLYEQKRQLAPDIEVTDAIAVLSEDFREAAKDIYYTEKDYLLDRVVGFGMYVVQVAFNEVGEQGNSDTGS